MKTKPEIICIGEILWDSMPGGLSLGGAPFNVAYHLQKLGGDVTFISRVGEDDPGTEAVKQAELNGISAEYIQTDATLPTGFVDVNFDRAGSPHYNIRKPAAWDEIRLTEAIKKKIHSADAVVFGTLAQRAKTSRNTIQWIETADCLKVLDLNLRPPFTDEAVIHKSLEMADLVKINSDELDVLRGLYHLSPDVKKSIEELSERFALEALCLTCGGDGAFFWNRGTWTKRKGYRVKVADTVGAGDAFLAGVVAGYLENLPDGELLDLSNRLGAWVAGQPGSTPPYSVASFSDLKTLPLDTEDKDEQAI